MKKRFLLVLAAILVCGTSVLTSCSNNDDNPIPEPTKPTDDKARLTIVFYGTIGDENDSIAEDMWRKAQQMLKVNKDVRMTVCWKYAKPNHFGGTYAKPGDLVMFELTDTTDLSKIGENYAQNKPEQALYDEQLLVDYINFAAEKAPAQDYCLWLFGHGAGFDALTDYEKDLRKPDVANPTTRGVLYDEWFPITEERGKSDALNMYELMRGIFYSNIPQFKLILFYDCLMGNLETLYDIYMMTDYIVASEHTLTMNNLPAEAFFNALGGYKDVETACREALNNINKAWDGSYDFFFGMWNGDLKLLKCSEMDQLIEPSAKLSSRLQELYPTMREQLDTALVRTYQIFNRTELYDFADYAHKVAELTGDAQLKEIVRQIDEAFDKIIIARREVHGGIYGDIPQFSLSFTLKNQEGYEKKTEWGYTFGEAYEYTNWHLFTEWGTWLKTNQQAPKDQTKALLGTPVGQAI